MQLAWFVGHLSQRSWVLLMLVVLLHFRPYCDGLLQISSRNGLGRKLITHHYCQLRRGTNENSLFLIVDDLKENVNYVKSLVASISHPSLHDSIKIIDVDDMNNINSISMKSSIVVMFPHSVALRTVTSKSLLSIMLLKEDMEVDIQRLNKIIAIALGVSKDRLPVPLEAGKWSHFLSLTFADLEPARHLFPALHQGIDAWELRVDLLADHSQVNIHRQIAYLRSFQPQLPIIYTLRTQSQLGQFPDLDFDDIERILMEGIKAGVEWLDVEASLPAPLQSRIVRFIKENPVYRRQTRLLGSWHTKDSLNSFSDTDLLGFFSRCLLPGEQADMVKIVTGPAPDTRIHSLAHQFIADFCSSQGRSLSYIALCLGNDGKLSRVLNQHFTPVTHSFLGKAAAPGQMSVQELSIARRSFLPKKQFVLFGRNISYSLSPAMHNAAFHSLQLPHQYSLVDAPDVSGVVEFLQEAKAKYGSDAEYVFGGASVTIPYKESIIPYLDVLSDAAEAIGAVNTVVPRYPPSAQSTEDNGDRRDVRLEGHNTDWLGIFKPLQQLLRQRHSTEMSPDSKRIGIVIGAGGTARAACYAINQLGLKLLVANRNFTKAEELGNRFNGSAIDLHALESGEAPSILQNATISVIISTLPAAVNFTLPKSLLPVTAMTPTEPMPIVFDVVYIPALTPLLLQAKDMGCAVIQGATMLLQQGIEQFQLWHERQAPGFTMRQAIFRKQLPVSDHPTNEEEERRVPNIDSVLDY